MSAGQRKETKMAVEFTNAQRTAIDVRGRTMLVSAAAGSGKTATLTERIIRELTDPEAPAEISDMLIVTFTRAAAGELRARIGAALSDALARDPENRHLSRQLIAVGGARICTIDSFYLDVVRENFQRLGLPASFRLADDSELSPLRRECMQNVIERLHISDPDFSRLCDCLTTARGDARLADTLLGIIPRLECLPRGMDTPADDADMLDREADGDFFSSRAGRCVLASLCDTLDDRKRTLASILDEIEDDPIYPAASVKAIRYDFDTVLALAGAAADGNEAELRRLFADYSPLNLGRFKSGEKTPRAEEIMAIRAKIRDGLIATRKKYFLMTPDEIRLAQRDTAVMLRVLSRALAAYRDAFREVKSSRSICEFSDIRSYAYSLLISADGTPTGTALDWRARFSEIFVDEYQDTDPVQDAIFRAVARPDNLFMVGDIKQSIYSFRGAEPSIFAAYRRDFAPITDGDRQNAPGAVFMSENFRCSKNIVDFTNAVSSYLFRESEASQYPHGIGYRPEDDLIFSRSGSCDEKVDIVLIDPAPAEAEDGTPPPISPADPEIEYVCQRIAELIAAGHQPGEVAVLSRTKDLAADVSKRLAALGISAANSVGEDLFADPEVLMLVSLLSAIDNPQRDIPLAAALRSPIFGFSLADLVRIRSGRTDGSLYDSVTEYSDNGVSPDLAARCRAALDRLAGWRAYAEAMPVDRLMRRVFDETTALMYSGSDPARARLSPTARRANLRRLYEYARKFDSSVFRGLSGFVAHINGMISEGIKIESDASAVRGAVSIMTIHKSKGLEFPYVFLIGFGKGFNQADAGDSFCFSPDAGMAMRLAGTDGISKLDTPMRRAAADRNAELYAEEEIRVLYVAMTRARDKLIITAKTGRSGSEHLLADAAQRASRGGRAAVIGAPSRICWILSALAAAACDEYCTVTTVNAADISTVETPRAASAAEESATAGELAGIIKERIEYVYPYSHLAGVPAKLSVSGLFPGALDDPDTRAPGARSAGGEARIPSFMETDPHRALTGAQLAAACGTATHLFLQFCDFSRLDGTPDAVDGEAARLTSLGYISSADAGLLRRDELLAFSRSSLFNEIRRAREVHRETRFNVMLPAAQFTTSAELAHDLDGEQILVQGVIDLFFTDENGSLVLCDYKTDRLSRAELSDPSLAAKKLAAAHSEQLGYYCAALGRITGKLPDRVTVYSLALGDCIDIPT